MDVIAAPVSVLPQVPGNVAVADGVNAAAANQPSGDVFGDLLARQLTLGMTALQLSDATDIKIDAQAGIQADAATSKATQDAAELAAQLQATLAAQTPVDPSAALIQPVLVQPPLVAQVVEVSTDAATTQKIDGLGEQQRQALAAIESELAAMKRAASPNAGAERLAAGKGQDMQGKEQLAALSPEAANAAMAAAKAQAAITPEVDVTKSLDASQEKHQSRSAASVTDTQSAQTSFAQMLSNQQNKVGTQSNTYALPTAAIDAPVNSPSWGSGLGDKVVWMVNQQQQGVELHLNPPALGPLEIRVSMSDGQANLSFMTQHQPVREAIEAATSRLREMLGDSGISMGSVSVNVGTFAQQQQPSAQSENGRSTQTPQQVSVDFGFSSDMPVVATRSMFSNGMVDTFA